MDRVYESQYHDWLSVHGGLAIMEQHGRSRAWEVIVIARREREREAVRILTNGATWRQSYGDGHTMLLNRGGRWCSDGEMVLGAGMRDWRQGGCNR
jgi:hypothetical protein